MSDPISPYRRGGFSSDHNTYSTWINNGTGKLFDTAADGSWLDNGDYERAYKGFPSYKQVNLFFGGTAYSTPSWKTTLGFGIGRLATTGIGLWLLSALGRKQQPTAQISVTANPYLTYFNNLKARFMPTGLSGTTGGTQGTGTTGGTQGTGGTGNTGNTGRTGGTQGAGNTGKVDNDNDGDKNKVFQAVAKNPTLGSIDIQGDVQNVVAGDSSTNGYPKSYQIHDSSRNTNNIKDANGKVKANIYYFEYSGMSSDNKPQYKCVKADIFTQKGVKFTQNNVYTVNKGFAQDSENKELYKIADNLDMVTNEKYYTVTETWNFDFTQDKATTYPPEKED